MRILNSFSTGKTSAFMSWVLKQRYAGHEIITGTANTGKEARESIAFGKKVDEYFGLNGFVVEAVVHPDEHKSSTHKLVTWDTCYFGDDIFAAVIRKYGIPNVEYLHCTRELKDNPIKSYLRSIGWEPGTYKIALGIRADEPDRISDNPRFIFPLVELGITKKDVNEFFETEMPFNLDIPARKGNCENCHKKSDKKLFLNMQENPESFEFNAQMERLYGDVGNQPGRPPRTFWRQNRSTETMRKQCAAIGKIDPRHDYADQETGCAQACMPFLDSPLDRFGLRRDCGKGCDMCANGVSHD